MIPKDTWLLTAIVELLMRAQQDGVAFKNYPKFAPPSDEEAIEFRKWLIKGLDPVILMTNRADVNVAANNGRAFFYAV